MNQSVRAIKTTCAILTFIIQSAYSNEYLSNNPHDNPILSERTDNILESDTITTINLDDQPITAVAQPLENDDTLYTDMDFPTKTLVLIGGGWSPAAASILSYQSQQIALFSVILHAVCLAGTAKLFYETEAQWNGKTRNTRVFFKAFITSLFVGSTTTSTLYYKHEDPTTYQMTIGFSCVFGAIVTMVWAKECYDCMYENQILNNL